MVEWMDDFMPYGFVYLKKLKASVDFCFCLFILIFSQRSGAGEDVRQPLWNLRNRKNLCTCVYLKNQKSFGRWLSSLLTPYEALVSDILRKSI